MKAYEHTLIGSRQGASRRPEFSPTLTWRVGKGRVTVAEIESWQLGPDLTEYFYEEEAFERS